MTNITDLQKKLDAHTREFLARAKNLRTVLQCVGIGAPVVVGSLKAIPTTHIPAEWLLTIAVLQFVFLAIGALAGLLVLLTDKPALAVMIDAQTIVEELADQNTALENAGRISQQLEFELSRSARLGLTIDSMRVAVDIELGSDASRPVEEIIGEILDLLVASKDTLFGMGDEHWNFSVYIWRPDRDELECVACRRPARADEDAAHRNWKPGEGHIGKAFQMKRALICADSTDLNVRGFFDAPRDKVAPTYNDSERYRSLAAIPIQLPGADEPIGVVVATSDKANRFKPTDEGDDSETVRPIRALSKTLATLIAVTNLRDQRERADAG